MENTHDNSSMLALFLKFYAQVVVYISNISNISNDNVVNISMHDKLLNELRKYRQTAAK